MTIIMIRNGVRTDLTEYLRVKEFYVEPLSIQYDEYKVDQGNTIVVPRGYNTRRITATFKFSNFNLDSYAGKLAFFRELFTHQEPFFLIDMHDSTKMWHVRNEGGFPSTRSALSADIEVSFICVNKYGMHTRGNNNITKLWSAGNNAWSDNISWSEEYENSFSGNNIEYNYLGTAPLDPRENASIIRLQGVFGSQVRIQNTTNGSDFIYNGSLISSDTLLLNGTDVSKNGTNVKNNTNYKVITLSPGINNLVVTGGTVNSLSLEHNFYYL